MCSMNVACDSHVHIVGPQDRYPWIASRTYTAPPALLSSLRQAAEPLGIGRFVIVQPSFYGTDNRATLDALDELGAAGRGVAVIDPANTSPDTLRDMHERGVRGVRINLYSTMAHGVPRLADAFLPLRDAAGRMGWHVQVIAPAAVLTGAAEMLGGAGVTVVLDHYGLPDAPPGSDAGQALLALASRPSVWVKLSGPYRFAVDPLASRPPADWLHALLAAAPGRTVWGSDWPHTPLHELAAGETPPQLPYRTIPYADLVRNFHDALPSAQRDGVMIANPARLYGFA